MRKTSYAATFVLVVATLFLDIYATTRNDWLVDNGTEFLRTKTAVKYGLMERCERQTVRMPGPTEGSEIVYRSDWTCRTFPATVTDGCEKGHRYFCAAWTSAGYAAELGIGFGALALLALLIGVSTHSRRRRIWRAVAGIVALQAIFPMITFAIVTDLYRTSRFPGFDHAHPGVAFYVIAAGWITSFAVMAGVIYTGIAADHGHRWAAGNRAYTRITDHP
ncbi:hypothetical protein FA95DRAFT_1484486 [Auriscalpium vulgare]|uniref:Uncharacterized protein n=1 Tax=Auriscalpium vulgare TaxID=40419 RepID=A0ACB8S7P8_9AGAM|nr:hypothetical protein FA95DRAFT_1484486 [Auriscalpium vulgare]